MDDEKYFSFSGDNMPSNAGFWSGDEEHLSPEVNFRSKQRFAHKILVWLAISSKGIPAPYIGTTKDDKYVFWPDLASSHYVKKTIEWLNEQIVPFVPRAANPPNVPKAKPIEDFWSILTDKVYNGGWEATNRKQLANRIRIQQKQIDLKVVQTMINDVRRKLRKIEDNEPFSIL
ncbi:unnamed protein product [Rotaria magnacalcarata]|uniref:Uncharacterized protein n=1 Tax=Rotaria magnacalcarata TaxID=392030 RepID=A0A8S2K7Q0_9BILA|nr:unnamed protein product [Rotaria magnacalcarata]